MRPAHLSKAALAKSVACNLWLPGASSAVSRPEDQDHSPRHSYDLGFFDMEEKLELFIDFMN
jgi:hypothetical protein